MLHCKTIAHIIDTVAKRITGRPVLYLELGVAHGRNLERVLERCPETVAVGVDQWLYDAEYAKFEKMRRRHKRQKFWDVAYAEAVTRTQRFSCELVRLTSAEAATKYDQCFDVIFIDADHREPAIRQDLALWWPKVYEHGVFAGHDYHPTEAVENDRLGVFHAVNDWARAHDRPLHCEPKYVVWWMERSERPEDPAFARFLHEVPRP